jgi:Tfp pilus assembly protein PilX
MKTNSTKRRCRARQRGGALIIVMLMLALLALFASANKRTNFGLNDELNRIEAEQIQRLKASGE